MKLYATTTSERASKGQGGNKFIEARFNIGEIENSERVLYVRISHQDNGFHLFIKGQEGEIIKDEAIHLKGKR